MLFVLLVIAAGFGASTGRSDSAHAPWNECQKACNDAVDTYSHRTHLCVCNNGRTYRIEHRVVPVR